MLSKKFNLVHILHKTHRKKYLYLALGLLFHFDEDSVVTWSRTDVSALGRLLVTCLTTGRTIAEVTGVRETGRMVTVRFDGAHLIKRYNDFD